MITTLHAEGSIAIVVWQFTMMMLLLPFALVTFWAYMKSPAFRYSDEQKDVAAKCRRVILAAIALYLLCGVVVFLVLKRMGI